MSSLSPQLIVKGNCPYEAPAEDDNHKNAKDKEGSNSDKFILPDDRDENRYVLLKSSDVREFVGCPICLGIMRGTKVVKECLHRFCGVCIEKSMRMGKRECPTCQIHLASRRSLRDDKHFDGLIAILYSDIDKFEREEFAFGEEEKARNKKVQASIARVRELQSGKKRTRETYNTNSASVIINQTLETPTATGQDVSKGL